MLERIDQALLQLTSEASRDSQQFAKLVEGVRERALQELEKQQQLYYQHYLERKKTFESEKDELSRFKLKDELQKHEQRVEQVLRGVHEKQTHNEQLLQAFEFNYHSSQAGKLTSQEKLIALRAQTKQLRDLLGAPGLFRSAKERTEALAKIEQNASSFRSKLQELKLKSTEVDLASLETEGSVDTICLELLRHKQLTKLRLTVKQPFCPNSAPEAGEHTVLSQQVLLGCLRVSLNEYERLMESVLLSHRLASLELRIMDMEFNQLKCELVKSRLLKLKHLSAVRLQNYYAEGKLGFFQDFNWHPYRKLIHVFAGKW